MSVLINLFDRFAKARILGHVSFWVATVLVLAYHGSLFGGNFRDNLINMLALLPTQIAAAYLLNYLQIPMWLYKQRYVLFALSLLVLAYLLAALARLSVIHLAQPIIGIGSLDESIGEILADPIYLIRVFVASIYIPAFLMFLIKMTKERFAQQNQMVMLEKEKQTSELNFLKAQMNPHFLFNTLNNLYGLSKNKSEQTPDMILKLSELLDYTIYECTEDTVPVAKEWELIQNYVDLEALRYGEQLMVALDEQIDEPAARIAPLILISLVENAFKYSLKMENDVPTIKISLKVVQNLLTFEVFNSKSSELNESDGKRGIGVQNVRRQLELQYPDRHSVHINDRENSYQVTLTVQL